MAARTDKFSTPRRHYYLISPDSKDWTSLRDPNGQIMHLMLAIHPASVLEVISLQSLVDHPAGSAAHFFCEWATAYISAKNTVILLEAQL
jgi:hypothetical protein